MAFCYIQNESMLYIDAYRENKGNTDLGRLQITIMIEA